MTRAPRTTPVIEKTWQQTKSENTRVLILDAAIDCFFEFGYRDTTTEKIAKAAGVSRGAMLHHFASRFELIKATVQHLNDKRLEMFEREEGEVQADAVHSRIDEGIDTYWRQLNTSYFVVFHELQVASRTDKELRSVLIPAIAAFDRRWYQASKAVFPDFALSEGFNHANGLTFFLLEGLAANQSTRQAKAVAVQLLTWLKLELRKSFSDVLTSTDRTAARARRVAAKPQPLRRKKST